MKDSRPIIIETKDCCPFYLRNGEEEVIQYFAKITSKIQTFYFSSDSREDKELHTVEFNHSEGRWWASRLVGESTFYFQDKFYKIIIRPRFGELFLFRMLEEIFNVRLAESSTSFRRERDFQFLIKKLISFLWLNMLAKVNIHGLPRNNINKSYRGSTVRGRIHVPLSIKSCYNTSEIVSNYFEKEIDETIAQIVFQAYNILLKDYSLGILKIPNNTKDAIIQLEIANLPRRNINKTEYQNIRYREIYKPFKKIVDYSWDIIQRKNYSNDLPKENAKESYSIFIDMAEIWELYLKSLLNKNLSLYGWSLRKDKIITYPGKYYQRELIPDIVFQRANDLLVWDAKYKVMKLDRGDFDRADYFQIHTYIQYFQQIENVICGGLLYPLSVPITEQFGLKASSPILFGRSKANTKFLIEKVRKTNFQLRSSKL